MRCSPAALAVSLAFAALPSIALAASANPDRPSVSASSYLVAPATLEGELGGVWYGSGSIGMPLLVKYSYQGTIEPRVGVDLARFDDGAPGITGEAKVKLVRKQTFGLALYAVSNVPVGSNERWWGTLRLLSDIDTGTPVTLTINTGADLGDVGTTVGVVGVPVILAASTPLFGSVGGFVEGAHTFADAGYGSIIDAGLGWRVTESLVVDAAGGWNFDVDDAYVTVGMTFNVGALGG